MADAPSLQLFLFSSIWHVGMRTGSTISIMGPGGKGQENCNSTGPGISELLLQMLVNEGIWTKSGPALIFVLNFNWSSVCIHSFAWGWFCFMIMELLQSGSCGPQICKYLLSSLYIKNFFTWVLNCREQLPTSKFMMWKCNNHVFKMWDFLHLMHLMSIKYLSPTV